MSSSCSALERNHDGDGRTRRPQSLVESPRIEVTLATGMSKEHSALINLGYKDPNTVDARDFEGDPKTLVIPRAGEMLYRVRPT